MAGFVALIFEASVLLLLVKNVHLTPHYVTGTRTISERIVMTSQTPVYYEKYSQCRYQICEDSEDYPEEDILRIMKNTKDMQGFFGVVLNSTTDSTLETRFGLGPPMKLCFIQFNGTFKPKVLRNVNLHWKFIVNVEGYFQRFTSEICMKQSNKKKNSNESCSTFGYECRQSYAEVYLLTFENGVIDFDKFMIPTTCNCVCDL